MADDPNSVIGTNAGPQRQNGIGGLLGMQSDTTAKPNAAAYSQQMNQAGQNAQAYGNLGQNYAQSIQNPYQDQSRAGIAGNVGAQQGLAAQLMNNHGEASKAQFQSGLDQGIAAQMAAANSARGGAVASAGARRAAMEQGGMQQAQGAAQAAALGAQEREASLAQAGNVYGNIGGQLQNQYGLEQGSAVQNQAQQNAMRLGYAGLANQSQGQGLQALNDYTGANMQAANLNYGMKRGDTADTNTMIGTAAGAVGSVLSGLAKGGSFDGRHPVVVGEEGPEVIVPQSPGYVLTAQQTAALRGAPPTDNQKASIASLFGHEHAPATPTPRPPSLSDALAGLEHLKAYLGGQGGHGG